MALSKTGPFYYNLINNHKSNRMIDYESLEVKVLLATNNSHAKGTLLDKSFDNSSEAIQIIKSIQKDCYQECETIDIIMDAFDDSDDKKDNLEEYRDILTNLFQINLPSLNEVNLVIYKHDGYCSKPDFLDTLQCLIRTFTLKQISHVKLSLNHIDQALFLIENAEIMESFISQHVPHIKQVTVIVHFQGYDPELLSVQLDKIGNIALRIFKFKFTLSNNFEETAIEFLSKLSKYLDATISSKDKIKITINDYSDNINLYQSICHSKYANIEYNLNASQFLNDTLRWPDNTPFVTLNSLIIVFTPFCHNLLEDICEQKLKLTLSCLKKLNKLACVFAIQPDNVTTKEKELITKTLFAMPSCVQILKLIQPPFIIDSQKIAATFPNLKSLKLTSQSDAYNGYDINYFIPLKVEILCLDCIGNNDFNFNPKLRLLMEFCLNVTMQGHNSDNQLNENSCTARQSIFQADEAFRRKTCNCGKIRSSFKNIIITKLRSDGFDCISYAKIDDWNLKLLKSVKKWN
uniref:KH domain-containing protein n=1 Tax=Rhabditophanes sp. KR3021 TaxID=114890 RepID=A0AC35TPZ1_9BILA